MKTRFRLLILLFFVCVIITSFSKETLSAHFQIENKQHSEHEELYLPSGTGLTLFSVGFKNVLADFLWFRTINYFGREFAGQQNYQFLIHYVNLVVDLNPRMDFVYQFGSMMFAWELHNPKESILLLNKAVSALPQNWLLRYYRGFMYFFFLNDKDNAKSDFIAAAQLPNAHPLVATLVKKITNNELNNDQALSTLSETTEDNSLKAFLKSKQ